MVNENVVDSVATADVASLASSAATDVAGTVATSAGLTTLQKGGLVAAGISGAVLVGLFTWKAVSWIKRKRAEKKGEPVTVDAKETNSK